MCYLVYHLCGGLFMSVLQNSQFLEATAYALCVLGATNRGLLILAYFSIAKSLFGLPKRAAPNIKLLP